MEPNTQVVMLTGASQRLGAEMACFLARQGYAVIAHTRALNETAKALKRSLDEQKLSCEIVEGDLGDVHAIAALFERALALYGRIDHLINNASSFAPHSIEEITVEVFSSMMAVHNSAPFFLSRALYEHLKREKRSGSIINICDATLPFPKASRPAYYIAKGALLAQTKALAVSLAPVVRVNAISPGPILPSSADEAYFKRMEERLPAGRTGDMDDVTRAVKFLLDSSFITGEELVVDGGLRLL